MKKFVLLLLSVLPCLVSFAQNTDDLKIDTPYAYHECLVLDRDFNVMQDTPSSDGNPIGLFSISEDSKMKYIIATLGEKSMYEIQVVNTVIGEPENGSRIDMYQGGMHFQGQIVIINVFLEYDLSRSSTIPEAVTFDVNNSPNFIQLKGLIPVHK